MFWDKKAKKILGKVDFWDSPDDAESVNSSDYNTGGGSRSKDYSGIFKDVKTEGFSEIDPETGIPTGYWNRTKRGWNATTQPFNLMKPDGYINPTGVALNAFTLQAPMIRPAAGAMGAIAGLIGGQPVSDEEVEKAFGGNISNDKDTKIVISPAAMASNTDTNVATGEKTKGSYYTELMARLNGDVDKVTVPDLGSTGSYLLS